MQDITKLINDVQRSVIDPSDRQTVQAAVIHYYKYLASVNFIQDEASIPKAQNDITEIVFKYLDKMTNDDLKKIARTEEGKTKKELIEMIKAAGGNK